MTKKALLSQVCRFGLVGVAAAVIHLSVVVLLVQSTDMAPLIANIFGFAIGFQMSYWGHRLWTFKATTSLHRVAFPKLLLIQILNFAANETLFYLFLLLNLPYAVALFIVLAILPLFTFVASKLWVFNA